MLRFCFALPAHADAWYEFAGARYGVDCAYAGDLRIAYVSCNGQEHGDDARPNPCDLGPQTPTAAQEFFGGKLRRRGRGAIDHIYNPAAVLQQLPLLRGP